MKTRRIARPRIATATLIPPRKIKVISLVCIIAIRLWVILLVLHVIIQKLLSLLNLHTIRTQVRILIPITIISKIEIRINSVDVPQLTKHFY